MASIINSNINSLNAQRHLSGSQASLAMSMQRLSSGLRINSAKDDAAGLGIAERFTAQIRGVNQAARNANDGISLAQTAEGALGSASSILQRVRELAVQSANATNSATDRKALQAEAGQLLSELDRIATTAQFNGQNILDGSLSSAVFQVGANANQTITATTGNFRTNVYGGNLIASAQTAAGSVAPSVAATITVNGLLSKAVTVAATDSAKTAAASINAVADSTGVTASARTLTELKFTGAGTFALTVTSSNTSAANLSFSVSAVGTAAGLAEAVKAFNDVSSQTGVTASLNTAASGIVLTNSAGDDIAITNGASSASITLDAYDAQASLTAGVDTFDGAVATAAAAGGTVATHGTIEFASDKGYSLTSTAAGYVAAAGQASTLQAVNTIDISTVNGSTKALKIIDSALAAVNSQRATFGALQSRFEASISNLQVTSENMSAARSRIQDADFAAETASLSRAQILQQAGTAMVAQANQLPQGVLSLLK